MNLTQSEKLAEILDNLRTFTYKEQGPDGQPVTVTVELFTPEQAEAVRFMFLQRYGTRPISDMLERCENGEFFSLNLADIIKATNAVKWGHMLGVNKSLYNPIWNVDGTETRTIETEYGKISTIAHGKTTTDAQIVDATSHIETSNTATSEQLAAAEHMTYHASDDKNAEPFTPYDKDTDHAGKAQQTDGGESDTRSNIGTVTHTNAGEDATKDTGKDTVTDTFKRGGNIGVTMTQAMLKAEVDFWRSYNFAYDWFATIADVLSIPYFGGE